MPEKNQRRTEIDIAKGLGMMLVIAGHATPPQDLQLLIYGFHMPLFFMASGILWRGAVDIKKTLRSLLVPFYLASIVSWLIWLIKQYIVKPDGVALHAPLLATLYGGNLDGQFLHNAPLWYLPALFSIYLSLALALRFVGQRSALVLLLMSGLLILSAATATRVSPDAFPMSALQGAVGGVFFVIGAWGRNIVLQSTRIDSIFLIGLVLVYAFIARVNGRVDLASLIFGSPWMYVAAGFLGSLACLRIARWGWIQQRWLSLLGQHSLYILVAHLPLMWIERFLLRAVGVAESWWLLTLATTCLFIFVFYWFERRAIQGLAVR